MYMKLLKINNKFLGRYLPPSKLLFYINI